MREDRPPLSEIVEVIPESWRHANAYLIKVGEGAVIDPGVDAGVCAGPLPGLVLATHGHYDHMASVDDWLAGGRSRFAIGRGDLPLLSDPQANASFFFGKARSFPDADIILDEGMSLELGAGFRLTVHLTPGHTPGSACFLLWQLSRSEEEIPLALFSGDTLFADSIGRCDLPYGDEAEMMRSLGRLRSFLAALPSDLPLLAGHGSASCCGRVLRDHPYLRRDS